MQAADLTISKQLNTKDTLLVGFGALILFSLGFWDQQFIGFETRFAVFAKEMLRHGPSFFPTTYGAPYPDYPATSTLFIYFLSLPFGKIYKLTAILPTALFSALTVALSYHFIKRFSLHWAYLTVLFEISTLTFLSEARSISLDQMVSCLTMICFYITYLSVYENKSKYLWLLPFLLFLGFIIRGPLGLVIPCGIICSIYCVSRNYKSMMIFWILALILLIVLWFAQLGLASYSGGNEFLEDVIKMQVSGRISGDKNASYLYYFKNSLGNYAPTFPFFLVVLIYCIFNFRNLRSHKDFTILLLLFAWVAVVTIGLSIPSFKKARYILPIVPAMSALAAYPFYVSQGRALEIIKLTFQTLLMIVPGFLLAMSMVASVYAEKHGVELNVNFMALFMLLALMQISALSLFSTLNSQSTRELSALGLATLAIWLTNYMLFEPAELVYHDAKTFVNHLEEVRMEKPAPLVFYKVAKDSDAIVYLANVDYDLDITFVNTSESLGQIAPPYYMLVEFKNLDSLNCPSPCEDHLIYEHKFYSEIYQAYFFE